MTDIPILGLYSILSITAWAGAFYLKMKLATRPAGIVAEN